VQVLLRRDVKGIGRRGDIVTVSSGHARNYLIPNGLAVEATDGAVEQAATVKKSRAVREAADRESARAIATAFAETPLVITAKAGATGKLFGSVTAADIVESLKAQGLDVDKHQIELPEPLRELGVFSLPVRLHPEVRASLKVWIVEE